VAVLVQALGLEGLDRLALAQAIEQRQLLGQALGREQAGQRLAQHLVGPVAEQALGGRVPAGDQAVRGGRDDRVARGGDDGFAAAFHQVDGPPGALQQGQHGEEGGRDGGQCQTQHTGIHAVPALGKVRLRQTHQQVEVVAAHRR
jgi:hypothetical protein